MLPQLFKDVEYQWSLVKRTKDESDEDIAKRLYYIQMEVYSANAGRDLISNHPSDPFQWDNLSKSIRNGWIKLASKIKVTKI